MKLNLKHKKKNLNTLKQRASYTYKTYIYVYKWFFMCLKSSSIECASTDVGCCWLLDDVDDDGLPIMYMMKVMLMICRSSSSQQCCLPGRHFVVARFAPRAWMCAPLCDCVYMKVWKWLFGVYKEPTRYTLWLSYRRHIMHLRIPYNIYSISM